jgi:hypothetical protein
MKKEKRPSTAAKNPLNWAKPITNTNAQATKTHWNLRHPHYIPTCGHHGPHMRHVLQLNGDARYLCRKCALAALAAEAQAAVVVRVRAQLDSLFVGYCLRTAFGSGGAAGHLAAMPAMIGSPSAPRSKGMEAMTS